MNIAFFLTPKSQISFLYDDFTLRQGLETMRYHGYSSIPVITREGKFIGTISEGDFLWYLIDNKNEEPYKLDMKGAERTKIKDILQPDKNSPVRITEPVETLLKKSEKQNYIPVIDDFDSFIGIITRKNIIKYFRENFGTLEEHR